MKDFNHSFVLWGAVSLILCHNGIVLAKKFIRATGNKFVGGTVAETEESGDGLKLEREFILVF